MLSNEWSPYYYEKKSGCAVQCKEKDLEMVWKASEESTLIIWTVENTAKITIDDVEANHKKDIQMKVKI